MKAIVIASLIALAFTTGFTCSKQAPTETAPAEQTAPAAQEEMAVEPTPADQTAPTEAAPTEGQPAPETK